MPAKFTAQEAARRRTEILDAAAAVFARKGYDATTVKDLEEATGLTRGGIFFHFPSKRDVFRACLERCSLEGQPFVARRALAATTAEDALMAVFRSVREWHTQHPEAMALFQQIALKKYDDPDLAQMDTEINESMHRFIAGVVGELQHRGVFNDDIDVGASAILLHGVILRLMDETAGMSPAEAEAHALPVLCVLSGGLTPRQTPAPTTT